MGPGSRRRRCLEILCAVLLPPLGVYLRHGCYSVRTQLTHPMFHFRHASLSPAEFPDAARRLLPEQMRFCTSVLHTILGYFVSLFFVIEASFDGLPVRLPRPPRCLRATLPQQQGLPAQSTRLPRVSLPYSATTPTRTTCRATSAPYVSSPYSSTTPATATTKTSTRRTTPPPAPPTSPSPDRPTIFG